MQDPFVDAEDSDMAEKERTKRLTLKGLNYNEPEKFDAAVNYSIKKITDIVDKILDGDIEKNPIKNGTGSACDFCEFKAACRFDDKCGGNRYRYPTYNKKDKDKVFSKIMEELGGTRDGLD